jgi:hypothetical protein
MNAFQSHGAILCALLVFSMPVAAQRVRFESQGEAFVAAEEKAMVEAALVRHVFGTPPSGKGQIVFFRPARSTDTAFEVRENGTELAKLPSGSYFVTAVQPGMHAYTIAETGDVLTVQVRPGRTHYVKATHRRTDGERPYLSRANAMTFLDMATGRRQSRL